MSRVRAYTNYLKAPMAILTALAYATTIDAESTSAPNWVEKAVIAAQANACYTPSTIKTVAEIAYSLVSEKDSCVLVDKGDDQVGMLIAKSILYSGESPVVVYVKTGQQTQASRRKTIVLRIVGGPAGSIAPSNIDEVYLASLSVGDMLISPGYSGTLYRSSYPNEDFSKAVKDVERYCVALNQANPHAKIILAGESLGGLIATVAMKGGCEPAVSGVVLLSPLITDPADAGRRVRQAMQRDGVTDPIKHVRLQTEQAGVRKPGRWASINSAELFEHFFSQNQSHISAWSLLKSKTSKPVILIYGVDDDRAGVNEIRKRELPESISVVAVVHMGHVPDPGAREVVAQAIQNFVQKTGR